MGKSISVTFEANISDNKFEKNLYRKNFKKIQNAAGEAGVLLEYNKKDHSLELTLIENHAKDNNKHPGRPTTNCHLKSGKLVKYSDVLKLQAYHRYNNEKVYKALNISKSNYYRRLEKMMDSPWYKKVIKKCPKNSKGKPLYSSEVKTFLGDNVF